MIGTPDKTYGGGAVDYKTASPRQRAKSGNFGKPLRGPLPPPRPADYKLPVGSNARPPGKGWGFVAYSWSEKTGVGRAVYRRTWDPTERLVIEVQQPANEYQDGWKKKPPIDREAVLARYFESQRTQIAMQALGVYGR